MVYISPSKSARQSCRWVSCHGSLSAKLRPHLSLARKLYNRPKPGRRRLAPLTQHHHYTPVSDEPGFNRGSGGGAQGCGFEKRLGHMRVQRGGHFP